MKEMGEIRQVYDEVVGRDRHLTLEEKIEQADINNYAPLISQIAVQDPVRRDFFAKKLARHLNVPVGVIRQEIAALSTQKAKSPIPGLTDPRPWPSQVSGAELAREVCELLRSHIKMEEEKTIAVTLWIFLTYTFQNFNVLPILAITSPEKRCGKTSLLNVLSGLVRRPLATSNISPAALYRIIQRWEPTLLIDEGDTFLTNNDELRGLLNSGHARHLAFVVRWNQEEGREEVFSTWAPKAVALIGGLPPTLADRSIEIRLARKRVDERVLRLPLNPLDAWEELRAKIMRWAEDVKFPTTVELPNVENDRAADNWLPLLAIAEALGGHWPAKAREAMLAIEASREETSIRTRLLEDIRIVFEQLGADKISTRDLITHLVEDETSPWSDFNRGRPLTAHGLAKLLRPFGIRPQTIRVGGDTPKGYLRKDFEEIWARYLPPRNATSPQLRNDAEKSGAENATFTLGVADQIGGKTASLHECCDVAFRERGEEDPLPEGDPLE